MISVKAFGAYFRTKNIKHACFRVMELLSAHEVNRKLLPWSMCKMSFGISQAGMACGRATSVVNDIKRLKMTKRKLAWIETKYDGESVQACVNLAQQRVLQAPPGHHFMLMLFACWREVSAAIESAQKTPRTGSQRKGGIQELSALKELYLHAVDTLRTVFLQTISNQHKVLVIKTARSPYLPGNKREWIKPKKAPSQDSGTPWTWPASEPFTGNTVEASLTTFSWQCPNNQEASR